MPDYFRIGTVILFVLRAEVVRRTIHAKLVLLGPPYFSQKLRLPLLSPSPSGQTKARQAGAGGGGLCSRLILLGILPYPYLRITRFLLLVTIRLLA